MSDVHWVQEAVAKGLEYCGFDIGHVPQCRYTDAAHSQAYGIELPPERRRQRLRRQRRRQ